MSAQDPTPNDLRTVAHNLQAEGQNSRAEVIYSAATKMERLQAIEKAAREFLHGYLIDEFCPNCWSRLPDHEAGCTAGTLATALGAAAQTAPAEAEEGR